MIQISVHGTKGGYKVLNPGGVKLWDPADESPTHLAKGNFVYSVAFYKQKKVYTKTIIVKDGGGNGRTGNLNFAIIIPWNKRMEGEDIRKILDEIHDHYKSNLEATDYTLDQRMPENWSFLDDIIKRYNSNNTVKPDDEEEHLMDSEQEPKHRLKAYAYYDDTEDLQRLLSAPYQKEYKPYLQIYFIDKQKKGQPDNPLKALKHSETADLSGRIKIIREKVEYMLKNLPLSGNIKLQVFKNNIELSPGVPAMFGLNDSIKIIYSQKHHENRTETLTIKNALSNPRTKNILIFHEGSNSFSINTDVELIPRYVISAGEHGELVRKGLYSNKKDGSDAKNYIEPSPGYRFIGFDLSEGILTARYEKKKDLKPFYVAGGVVLLCVMIFVGATYLFESENEINESNPIEALLQEDSWYLNELEAKSNEICININSETYKNNQQECIKLNKAIAFRNLLNKGYLDSIAKKNFLDDPDVGQYESLKNILKVIQGIKKKFSSKTISNYFIKEPISTMKLSEAGKLIADIETLLEVQTAIKFMKDADSLNTRADIIKGISRPDSLKKAISNQIASKLGEKKPTPDTKENGASKGPKQSGGGSSAGDGSGVSGDPNSTTKKAEAELLSKIKLYYNHDPNYSKVDLTRDISDFKMKNPKSAKISNIGEIKSKVASTANRNDDRLSTDISRCNDLECVFKLLKNK
jgi:hypothetical protein